MRYNSSFIIYRPFKDIRHFLTLRYYWFPVWYCWHALPNANVIPARLNSTGWDYLHSMDIRLMCSDCTPMTITKSISVFLSMINYHSWNIFALIILLLYLILHELIGCLDIYPWSWKWCKIYSLANLKIGIIRWRRLGIIIILAIKYFLILKIYLFL